MFSVFYHVLYVCKSYLLKLSSGLAASGLSEGIFSMFVYSQTHSHAAGHPSLFCVLFNKY